MIIGWTKTRTDEPDPDRLPDRFLILRGMAFESLELLTDGTALTLRIVRRGFLRNLLFLSTVCLAIGAVVFLGLKHIPWRSGATPSHPEAIAAAVGAFVWLVGASRLAYQLQLSWNDRTLGVLRGNSDGGVRLRLHTEREQLELDIGAAQLHEGKASRVLLHQAGCEVDLLNPRVLTWQSSRGLVLLYMPGSRDWPRACDAILAWHAKCHDPRL